MILHNPLTSYWSRILAGTFLLALALVVLLLPGYAHAQTTAPASPSASWQTWLTTIGGILGSVVTIASILANAVSPESGLGKVLHWLALNGPTIQRAVASAKASVTESSTAEPEKPGTTP